MTYIAPKFRGKRFTCPTCGTLSQMSWFELLDPDQNYDVFEQFDDDTHDLLRNRWFYGVLCIASGCFGLWLQVRHVEGTTTSFTDKMVYPPATHGAAPSPDIPESAKELYLEAGNVLSGSARAAAALLRMCTEDIIKHLTTKQDKQKTLRERASLYHRIEFLREHDKLWPGEEIDDALDVLRVIGNDAVHSPEPREIRGDDDSQQVAESLFMLVDMITEQLITRRRKARSLKQLIEKKAK